MCIYSRNNYMDPNWLFPIINKGRKQILKEEDLHEASQYHTSEYLGDLLQKEWKKELQKKNPSILKAALHFVGWKYLIVILLVLIQETAVVAGQAYFVGLTVRYFENRQEWNHYNVYVTIAGFFTVTAIYLFTYNINLFMTEYYAMKLKVAFCTLTYRKAIRLSSSSLEKSNMGQMVNLLANDISKFQNRIFSIALLFTSPFFIIFSILTLWPYYGWTILMGFLVVFLFLPIQFALSKLYSKLRLQAAILADERLNLLNEMIADMRLIKMYTWELPYAALIEKIRLKEMKTIRMILYVSGISSILSYPITKLFTLLSFVTIILNGGELNAKIVFVTMVYSVYIFISIINLFSIAMSFVSDILVSLKRIQGFLLLHEKENNAAKTVEEEDNLKEIRMDTVTAAWEKGTETTLNGISLNIQPGELLLVVGQVGSGKTSLLMSMLGEIPITSGEVSLKGKISYASQEAWVFNATVKENILFGEEYHEEKYKKILHITALEKDIRLFPKGDQTIVGERGVIMSGGQKARINLARALYVDADIFLLDDPLSAVDVPVAKHIFEKCIMEYLKDKICVLVTHQIQFLNSASKILVLNKGRCEFVGNFNALEHLEMLTGILPKKEVAKNSMDLETAVFNDEEIIGITQSEVNNHIANNHHGNAEADNKIPHNNEKVKKPEISVYKAYVNAGAGLYFKIVILSMVIISLSVTSASDYWLLKWLQNIRIDSQNEENLENMTSNRSLFNEIKNKNFYHSKYFDMYVYIGLICAVFLTWLPSGLLLYKFLTIASFKLHNNMFRCIIRTPIAFLDNNPVGKILNRFSKDVSSMDEMIPSFTYLCIRGGLILVCTCIVQAIVYPYLLVLIAVLSVILYAFWTIFSRVLKSIKHLEGKLRSPVFSHLSVSLYGLTTIRAFNADSKFKSMFNKYQDKHTATWFIYLALIRWLSIYGSIICFINLIITVIVFGVSNNADDAGSQIGLILNYGILINLYVQHVIGCASEMEFQMNSVKRILKYSNLKSEASYESLPNQRPPSDWPEKGEIHFDNVSLQYTKDENIVLKNLTFHIHSGEKIGIVGRTGAGKSSIIAALFRMTEPTGTITIDGVDIKDIGLRDLRSKISIIPQDPMLFTGPLRRNMDPFNEYSEEMLWKAIEEVQLKEVISKLPGGLDSHLTEGGRNISVGERQLICLARTILRQNKILVLDEATSNIDKRTDSCLQKIIREKFKSCTVLTIAHRLHTIIDSDRVLVLDTGRVQDFDSPYALLKNVNGIFYNLVQKTGVTSMNELYEIAKVKYYAKERVEQTKL
ncbi:multidrug resistance-associated protein 4-like isoform X2 [Centruroides sculpturatus]|uniref:multidrug resistance-associated protein 4-like isoform X2 n=1 Tax=Centruroides sculpturatus TaxID=218467 RepID=UPI000C6E64C9|nr:multidrug resistance-associated protein 4-like isoform X2 [Centruroides sculpturatus]XP_023225490.1 multidrug resistance-associated protein 4-like isoform X2 [Centruroides sculpturatus]